MLVIPQVKKHRVKRVWPSSANAAPVLLSALYDPGISVLLTFDRAITVAGLLPAAITVDDPETVGRTLVGIDYESAGDNAVRIYLENSGASTGLATVLNATTPNGIVATSGGAAWAGVTGFGVEE